MAKITRTKLARGAKLLVEHIFSPLQSAQTQVTSTAGSNGFDSEQLDASYAPFRVNLNIPSMSVFTNPGTPPSGDGGPMHAVPFMLPPLQEDLSFNDYYNAGAGSNTPVGKTPRVNANMKPVILDEVSVSFDQRCEPAAICSNWFEDPATQGNSASQGHLNYERLNNYDLQFMILEKKPTWGRAIQSNTNPTRIVWSGEVISRVELASKYRRSGNPYVVTDIRASIDPYMTYLFVLVAKSGLSATPTTQFVQLVSVEVSMKFLSPLRERDSGASIQNIPSRHLGERNKAHTVGFGWTVTGAGKHSNVPRPIMGASPGATETVAANTTKGVQTFMATLDEFFRAKLKGGYSMRSEPSPLESIRDSAAYSVIAVPLFNNTEWGGISLHDPVGYPRGVPYTGNDASAIIDRRYIPIVAPMTIHHVLFTWSWMPFIVPDGGSIKHIRELPMGSAAAQVLKADLGVGIGTGARADMYGYEQVASKTITDPTDAAYRREAVDLILFQNRILMPTVNGDPNSHNLELHAMNIVGSGRPGLNGMTSQGYPVFAGKARTGVGASVASQRENMQSGSAPKTLGAEQFIEVRAKVYDLNNDWGSNWTADQMLLGTGGIWVYIIGKTHLV